MFFLNSSKGQSSLASHKFLIYLNVPCGLFFFMAFIGSFLCISAINCQTVEELETRQRNWVLRHKWPCVSSSSIQTKGSQPPKTLFLWTTIGEKLFKVPLEAVHMRTLFCKNANVLHYFVRHKDPENAAPGNALF